MGLINWAITYALFGREKAMMVSTFNYMETQARMRHEEQMDQMEREHQERVAIESQRR